MSRPLTILVMAILAIVIAFSFLGHRMNANEKLAGRVLESVRNNDMSPVAKDFNAVTRERLTRASVGRNSDLLAPFGKLRRVTETTPKDAPERRHTFRATFEKGEVDVTMVLDADGKITGFRFVPAGSGNNP